MAKSNPYKDLKFEKFNVEGGWSSFDRLGKFRLDDGEFVILQWPDGEYEKVKVSVRRSCEMVQDMGTQAETWYNNAYAKINLHGCPYELRLVEFKNLKGASLKQRD